MSVHHTYKGFVVVSYYDPARHVRTHTVPELERSFPSEAAAHTAIDDYLLPPEERCEHGTSRVRCIACSPSEQARQRFLSMGIEP